MVAKPEKAKQVENLLVNMAQTGRLQGKVSESELVNMLGQISSTSRTTTVKVYNTFIMTRLRCVKKWMINDLFPV